MKKSTSREKLKTASQEERIQKGKEHFKNLLGNPTKVTDKPITKINNTQLDIRLEKFTEEELNVLKKIKTRKSAGLQEILPEVWKTREFDNILLRLCNIVYKQNTIENW